MKSEYKIIADHLRSSCFLIADGILPSNEGRGYVLRRIMRRAMLQLHKVGVRKTLMYKFVDLLISQMSQAFCELSQARATIIETLKNEEEQFQKTLEKGLKILEEEISLNKNLKILSGKIAFKLYDTYGFPLDLTQNILKEKNIEVDIQEFEQEMEKQRQRSQASWKGSGEEFENQEILKLQEEIQATTFSGYQEFQTSSKILMILVDGKKQNEIDENDNDKNIAIILDKTPFYANSGGQKADIGIFENNKNKLEIFDVRKIGKLFIHQGNFVKGKFAINDEIIAKINQETREKLAANHSATHLMHKALKLILGNSISQKGSNVDENYFTFDFNFNRAMTPQEIAQIEDLVNFYINQSHATKIEVMSLEDAKNQGAEALFGEKYENQVRVISMGFDEKENKNYSVELCGGTHIKNTKEIEFFKIISEKSIASGIRRIEAKTKKEAKNFILNQLQKLQDEILQKNLKIQNLKNLEKSDEIKVLKFSLENFDAKIIENEIKNLQEISNKKDEEIKILNKELQNLKKQNLLKNLDDLKVEKIENINFISHIFNEIDAKDLREIVLNLQEKPDFKQNSIFAIFAINQEKVSAIIAISKDLLDKFDANILIKEIGQFIGAKGGGGKKDFAMSGGDNKDGIVKAIGKIKQKLEL